MNEIIAVGAENVVEAQNLFRGIAEKYKDPNNQQDTLTGFSDESREKLKIKGPNYVPGYDFSQAIIEQTLHNKEWIDRRGGLQRTSEGFLEFIENMGINTQDPSMPLKKLAEEYLLRPYVTKVRLAKPAQAPETAAVVDPNLAQVPPKSEAIPATETPAAPQGEVPPLQQAAATPEEETVEARVAAEPTEAPAEGETPAATETETPAQKVSNVTRVLKTINDFLKKPSETRAAMKQSERESIEAMAAAVNRFPNLFERIFRKSEKQLEKETPPETQPPAAEAPTVTPPPQEQAAATPEEETVEARVAAEPTEAPAEGETPAVIRNVESRKLWSNHAKVVLGLKRPKKRTLEGINTYYNSLKREKYTLTPEEDGLQKRIQKRIADRMYD